VWGDRYICFHFPATVKREYSQPASEHATPIQTGNGQSDYGRAQGYSDPVYEQLSPPPSAVIQMQRKEEAVGGAMGWGTGGDGGRKRKGRWGRVVGVKGLGWMGGRRCVKGWEDRGRC
jgi:hypothetical protein